MTKKLKNLCHSYVTSNAVVLLTENLFERNLNYHKDTIMLYTVSNIDKKEKQGEQHSSIGIYSYIYARSTLPYEITDNTVKKFIDHTVEMTKGLEKDERAEAIKALVDIYAFWNGCNKDIKAKIDNSTVLNTFITSLGNVNSYRKFRYYLPPQMDEPMTLGKKILYSIFEGENPDNFGGMDKVRLIFNKHTKNLSHIEKKYLYKNLRHFTSNLSIEGKTFAIESLLIYLNIRSITPYDLPEILKDEDMLECINSMKSDRDFANYVNKTEEYFDEYDVTPEYFAFLLNQKKKIREIIEIQTYKLSGRHKEIASILIDEMLRKMYQINRDLTFQSLFGDWKMDKAYTDLLSYMRDNKTFEDYILKKDDAILKFKFTSDTGEKKWVQPIFREGRYEKRFKRLKRGIDDISPEAQEMAFSIYEKSAKIYQLSRCGIFDHQEIKRIIDIFKTQKSFDERIGLEKFVNKISKRHKQDPLIRYFYNTLYHLSREVSIDGYNPILRLVEDKSFRRFLNRVDKKLWIDVGYSIKERDGNHYILVESKLCKASLLIPVPIKRYQYNAPRSLEEYLNFVNYKTVF